MILLVQSSNDSSFKSSPLTLGIIQAADTDEDLWTRSCSLLQRYVTAADAQGTLGRPGEHFKNALRCTIYFSLDLFLARTDMKQYMAKHTRKGTETRHQLPPLED